MTARADTGRLKTFFSTNENFTDKQIRFGEPAEEFNDTQDLFGEAFDEWRISNTDYNSPEQVLDEAYYSIKLRLLPVRLSAIPALPHQA